jgi:GTPase SAR1 family protein
MARATIAEIPICLVGLPGAGKTTFLAAFWASARDTSKPAGYTIAAFPADPTYLQRIAEPWFLGRVVDHNSSASFEATELVVHAEGRTDLLLRIPDLSGETFRDAAADRELDVRIADVIRESRLILFFVNAATATTPVSLADLDADPGDAGEGAIREFEPKELETDVLNAELLHILQDLSPMPGHPPPVVVLVSAWDVVDEQGQTPAQWLDNNQPMFAQVVAEYGRLSAVTVMGISAQGADYAAHPEIVEKPPRQRPFVVTNDGRSTDVGQPLAWFNDLLHTNPNGG